MSVRVRLVGLAGPARTTTIDGWYLVSCDVNENQGRGAIFASPNPDEAMVFDDAGQALEYWKRQSTKVPLRPDGKPNRPLTMYTVQIEKIN